MPPPFLPNAQPDLASQLADTRARLAELEARGSALREPGLGDRFQALINAQVEGTGFGTALEKQANSRLNRDLARRAAAVDEEQLGVNIAQENRLQVQQIIDEFNAAADRGEKAAIRVREMVAGAPREEQAAVMQEILRIEEEEGSEDREPVGLEVDQLVQQAAANVGVDLTARFAPGDTEVVSSRDPEGNLVSQLIDSGTGEVIQEIGRGPVRQENIDVRTAEGEPPETPVTPILTDVPDITEATGASGFFTNIANVAADLFGADLPFGEAANATEALVTLERFTKLALQDAVPGKPSNFLLEQLGDFGVQPNELFSGDERAKIRLRDTRNFVANQVETLERDILGNPTSFLPKQVSDTRAKTSQLRQLLQAYDTVLSAIGDTGERPPLESFIEK